jgi:hypothetical protein
MNPRYDADTDIVLMATYWNEKNWIEPSLNQIKKIDPVEVVISEGCFDPEKPISSTDGTHDRVQEFVREYDRAKMITAQRPSTVEAVRSVLRGRGRSLLRRLTTFTGWKGVYKVLRNVAYRRNQAATFNKMIRLSEAWEPGRWFMTYDADQFYTDSMISDFKLTKQNIQADLLTGTEMTFFESFDKYTEEYEQRTYNNMPHRIYQGTMIRPTRDITIETSLTSELLTEGILSSDLYINQVTTHNVGRYHHYKVGDPVRIAAAYELGDRKRPTETSYNFQTFDGEYPSAVKDFIYNWKNN